METKIIKCDHCGKEIREYEYGALSIDRIILKDWYNESDAYPMYSGKYKLDALDLCPDCAISFLAFFKLPSWIKKIVEHNTTKGNKSK